jgi:hypothetical protein
VSFISSFLIAITLTPHIIKFKSNIKN